MGQKHLLNLNERRHTTTQTGRVEWFISSSIFSVAERTVFYKDVIVYCRQNTE
jgi:hypothetical protein